MKKLTDADNNWAITLAAFTWVVNFFNFIEHSVSSYYFLCIFSMSC